MKQNQSSKVFFYLVATHLGGAERSILDVILKLERQSIGKYKPFVILPKSDGPLLDILKKASIDYFVVFFPNFLLKMSRSRRLLPQLFVLNLNFFIFVYYIYKVTNLIRREKPAILHSNALKCHITGAIAAKLSGTPLIWHLRDIYPAGFTLSLLRVFRKLFNPFWIANSEATALNLKTELQKESVIHDGIDTSQWSIARTSKKSPHPIYRVGIVGILAQWKGQLEFLEMARKLIDSGIKAQFCIVGGEIYDTQSDEGFLGVLRKKTQDLHLLNDVQFTGYVKDPSSLVRGFDVLVHASIRPEPFGRVIVEAMASRTVVVASNAGGVPEIIEHEKNGLLFTPGNPDEMAQAVKRILLDSNLQTKLIKNAYESFTKNFTAEVHTRKIIDFYDRLTQKSV